MGRDRRVRVLNSTSQVRKISKTRHPLLPFLVVKFSLSGHLFSLNYSAPHTGAGSPLFLGLLLDILLLPFFFHIVSGVGTSKFVNSLLFFFLRLRFRKKGSQFFSSFYSYFRNLPMDPTYTPPPPSFCKEEDETQSSLFFLVKGRTFLSPSLLGYCRHLLSEVGGRYAPFPSPADSIRAYLSSFPR